ncbi:MAG: Shell matrix protein [Parcubacteria group bacterium GW2011_GWA2_53_21]|nr:MAG: Shell matrix protein [Parcubacteria group bacterium GW2011_GWA2_53_21]
MTRFLFPLLAIAAVFLTSCVEEGDIPSWHDRESESDDPAEPDTASPGDTDLPDGPSGDDDSDVDDDDDATDPDLPGGPSDDDDDTTPPANDDDDATEPDLPSDDDDDALPDDDDDATDPDLPTDDDDDATPPSDDDDDVTPEPPVDADGDGYPSDVDCNDTDPAIHPAAPEVCNGLDDNCNGTLPGNDVDEDEDGVLECAGDCDDEDDTIHPGATETCDSLDSDCDGSVPVNESDADADGWMLCEADCDDADADINPGEAEICDDGIDQNCDDADPVCPPPTWCPTGTIVTLTDNAGFEDSEPMELFPPLGARWGYGEFLLSSPPARVCSGIAYDGACSLALYGAAGMPEYGGASWENQVRYLVDPDAELLQAGDPVHLELFLRGSGSGLSVGIELIENWAYTPMTSIATVFPSVPSGSWSSVVLDGVMTSVSGTLRLELQYGGLDPGETVWADDVLLQACL